MIDRTVEVAFTGDHSVAGAASIPGPFTAFDPHLVLLLVLLGYILLYVALVAIDSFAALLQVDIPTTDDEGGVDGNGIKMSRGPD